MIFLIPMPFEPFCHTTHYKSRYERALNLLNLARCSMVFYRSVHEPTRGLSAIGDSELSE
jgi:hypothetical protein